VAGLGAICLPLGLAQIVAWPATQLLNYVIFITEKVADLPGSLQTLQPPLWLTLIIFAAILLIIIYLKRVTKHNFRDDNVVD